MHWLVSVPQTHLSRMWVFKDKNNNKHETKKNSPFTDVEDARRLEDHGMEIFLQTFMADVVHGPVPVVVIIRAENLSNRHNTKN